MFRTGLFIIGFILIADQAMKAILMQALDEPGEVITVTSFFNLVPVWNRGISFGLFHNDPLAPFLLIGLAAIISLFLLIWLKRTSRRYTAYALGLVTGGAIGNIVDRLYHGAVFDFLDFHLSGYHWPAFNVADSAICIGAVMIALEGFFVTPKPMKKAKLQKESLKPAVQLKD